MRLISAGPGFKSLHRHVPRRHVLATRSSARAAGRAVDACSSRSPAARTRSRCCTCSASCRRDGELDGRRASAHLNHGLRRGRRTTTRLLPERSPLTLGVPFACERADVRALARDVAHLARRRRPRARYAFLERAAASSGADAIATGHTRDDQAETFLLRLIRGAGPRGLSAISPRARSRSCRPLLDVRRDEIRGVARRRAAWLPRGRIRTRDLAFRGTGSGTS